MPDMNEMHSKALLPDREQFSGDPFGYCGCAWVKWAMASRAMSAGSTLDPEKPPTSEELKNPVLWLSQSKALSMSAFELLNLNPEYLDYPSFLRGMIDSQFRATSMMLLGYSLEVALKAMRILTEGVDVYSENERKYFTHNLVELADFIPELTEKDQGILRQFTHFLSWAGRYPDPGSKRIGSAEEIHKISADHEIAMKEVIELHSKIMTHITSMVENT